MGDRGMDVALAYEFPGELARKLAEARPDLTPRDVDRVLESLRAFLAACALTRPRSAVPLAAPSAAVGVAWRQLILLTADYRTFCADAFGGLLHHATLPPGEEARHALDRTQQALEELDRRRFDRTAMARATMEGALSTEGSQSSISDSPVNETAAVATVAPGPIQPMSASTANAVRPSRGSALRARFIAGYDFPTELWADVAEQHPHLDRERVAIVVEGLRHYLLMCLVNQTQDSRHPVGMPSRVVDDAWHAFIVKTEAYEDFCRRAFDGYLHHTPRAAMRTPMIIALANAYQRACDIVALTSQGTTPRKRPDRDDSHGWSEVTLRAALPSLFAIDRVLAVPGGYTYDELTMSHIEARSQTWEHGGSGTDSARDRWSGSVGGYGGGCAGGCGGGGG